MAADPSLRRRHMRTVAPLLGVLAMMGVLMYYAVPLYNMFCQVTGIGGTTQRAEAADAREVVDETITLRFSTEVQPDLPWDFYPEKRSVRLKLGEPKTVFFRAESRADEAIVGHAAYNVTPLKIGRYVNKIECFCFTQEKLGPGESVRMPVQVFVSPDMLKDSTTDEVRTITMAYHFFRAANPDEDAPDLKRLDTPKDEGRDERAATPNGAGADDA
jgi:cytochrome c oxidase assembly protein subunit 11